jgi:hypothetical protein
MQPISSQDHFIVTGISSRVAVESIHVIAHSSSRDKALEILSKEISDEIVITRNGFLYDKRTSNNLAEDDVKLPITEETDKQDHSDADQAEMRKVRLFAVA